MNKISKEKILQTKLETNEYGQRICSAKHVFTFKEEHEDKCS